MYTDRASLNLRQRLSQVARLVLASTVLIFAGVADGAAAPTEAAMTRDPMAAIVLATPQVLTAADANHTVVAAPMLAILGLPLRTIFLLAHVAALAVGMGGALLLDGYLFGYLYRRAVT